MLKLILGVSRRADWSREDWLTHYKERHGPLVAGLDVFGRHTRCYVQNYAFPPPSATPIANHATQIDGISELWFSDLKSIRAAYADPAYMSVVRPDELSFCDLNSIVGGIGREHVIMAEPLADNDRKWAHRSRYRAIIFRKAAAQRPDSALQGEWLDAAAEISREENFRRYVCGYTQTHIQNEESPLPSSCPYGVIDQFSFHSGEDAVVYWNKTRSANVIEQLERTVTLPGEALVCFLASHCVFEDI